MRLLLLGIKDMLVRWRAVLMMALTISFPIGIYLLLSAYQAGLEKRYQDLRDDYLLVQETGSLGDFYGSRLPASLKDELLELGMPWAEGEIQTVTGTSYDDAVLLRGINPAHYAEFDPFSLLAGRLLTPTDPARSAMLGIKLAEKWNAFPGGSIAIRGRDFRVVGVFSNGTSADYEAWVKVSDAQALLGWDTDVSVFVIAAGGVFSAGDVIRTGISVVQKGESGQALLKEWQPIFSLFRMVTSVLSLAVAFTLANTLWRLAWLRRRQHAILLSIGFRRLSLVAHLAVQGFGITGLAYALGVMQALLVGALIPIRTSGISIEAVFELRNLVTSLAFSSMIALIGTTLPVYWLSRHNLAGLMKKMD